MKHVKMIFPQWAVTKYTALTRHNLMTGSGYAGGLNSIWPWSVERSVPGLTIPSRNPNVNLLKSTTENPFSLLMMSNTMLWSIPPTISVHALLLTVYGHFLQEFIPHSLSELLSLIILAAAKTNRSSCRSIQTATITSFPTIIVWT